MDAQLSLFQSPTRRKFRGNPYRDTYGRYCSKREAEEAAKEMEIRKLKDKAAYLERKVEMYERMAIAVSKRLTEKNREMAEWQTLRG